MLDEFLTQFYQVISFGSGEPFSAERFRVLFRPDALLLERTDAGYISKTADEHIQEFEMVVRDYPELFTEGFTERQTSLKWTEQNGVYLVHSGYEKHYVRGGEPVTEYGVNHFTILVDGGTPRIACAVWE
ncbi:MAG: hypothetical protein HFF19_08015 [Oscillospiraceae bacterium]|jgi:hypothetical protein|nr:hypothetical protein [Oscillospiraceae bacterium]